MCAVRFLFIPFLLLLPSSSSPLLATSARLFLCIGPLVMPFPNSHFILPMLLPFLFTVDEAILAASNLTLLQDYGGHDALQNAADDHAAWLDILQLRHQPAMIGGG